MTNVDESLIGRVRKLLDKAEGTENPHEAEAFAAKAADLVARHRIDPDTLADRRASSDDLKLSEIHVGRGAYVRGRLSLLGNVAEAHDVRMVFQTTPTGSVALLAGLNDDLALVEVIYASLHSQVSTQMAGIKKTTGAATQRERRAFLFGFADRIGEILTESQVAAEQASRQAGHDPATTALAVVERRERVDEFATASWGRVRSAGRPKGVSPDGYVSGANAANRADVGRTRLGARAAIGPGGR